MTTEGTPDLVLTEAEQRIDEILRQRRTRGRKEYGKGLTHTDAYDWNLMAMEEFADAAQYLAAENLRLLGRIEGHQKDIRAAMAHAARLTRTVTALQRQLQEGPPEAKALLVQLQSEVDSMEWMRTERE